MSDTLTAEIETFIQVSEIWVPEGGMLVHKGGNYGGLEAFEEASRRERFGKGEGLPGKAWAEGKPVVLKEFDGSYFKRAEAAKEAGLTAAVAIPVFAGEEIKAVLVVLCGDDDERTGAIEVWTEQKDVLMLDDGYYGAAKHFEWVSQHTHFPIGQGLPGGVWAAKTPIMMRDLGTGYAFIRSESAGRAGLTTGLGLPVPSPDGKNRVLTLLSARGTPIARRFEIWDVAAPRAGAAPEAILIDGICEREGPLGPKENPPVDAAKAAAWRGPIGQVLGTGMPHIQAGPAGLPAGYRLMVSLPIYQEAELAFVVAWYL
ncbi:GAF domain-containing protein [Mangrovicoccus sp. HB161399]|uniref:GAF domain-containing protein n=1 Tax=Mangrovicoccus sp. HB161399 TaxID=2720392 RepID=UPI001553E222|nr:GAF domain-containing protein [Mangrovicoccus sp. HB161399]